jgi:hypothetical protein
MVFDYYSFLWLVYMYIFLIFFVVYNVLGCFVDVKLLNTCNLILTLRENEILI